MKAMEVGCAVIEQKGKILIAQRLPGDSFGGYWEFPGGKRRPEEDICACLVREVREELGVRIRPRRFLGRAVHAYPQTQIHLYFYLCGVIWGDPVRHDCFDFRWVRPEEMHGFLFPPADWDLINDLIRKKRHYFGR